MAGRGRNPTPQKLLQSRQNEATILDLRLRGVSCLEISRKIGMAPESVSRAYHRALKRISLPKAEEVRATLLARNDLMRVKIWGEMAGRVDKNGETVLPSVHVMVQLIMMALRLDMHEAKLMGVNAPTKTTPDTLRQPGFTGVSLEEAETMLARLTYKEQEEFNRLIMKAQGRGIQDPPPEPAAIETTKTLVPEVSAEPKAEEKKDARKPATDALFGPCPKCGSVPVPQECPMYNNGVLTSHGQCSPGRST